MSTWEDLQQSILHGDEEDDLEPEDTGEAAPGPTYEQAVTHARRLKFHRERIAQMEHECNALLEELDRQMEAVRKAHAIRVAPHDSSADYHENRLIAYAQAHPPHRGKTVTVPGATISARTPAPKLVIADPEQLIQTLQTRGLHSCLRIHSPELNLSALNSKVREELDGYVTIGGESLPGVSMVRPGDVYTVHLSKGGE